MLKKLLIVVAVLVLVGGFFLTKDYDSPELGQSLLDRLGEATGLQLAASGFRFNLFKGVELTGVTARSSRDGRELDVALDTLLLEHRLGPLLSGTVAVDRILLARPTITLVESETGAAGDPAESSDEPGDEPTASGASGEEGGLTLEVKEIVVSDGTLVLRAADGAETRVEGLAFNMADLKLDPSAGSLAGIGARGQLAIDRIGLDEVSLSSVSSQFQLSDAVFDLAELSFDSEHGSFTATARVDFKPVPFEYTMAAEGKPLDLNGIMGASGGFGPATITLDAKGAGPDVADVVADGALHLGAGEFPGIAMMSGIDAALGKKVVSGATYEDTSAQVRLEDGVVRLAPFRFTTELARLDLEGTVDLAGPLSLRLAVATPREGLQIAGAGGAVLDVLADDSGWVPIPMTVSGTLQESKVRPDTQALTAQAKSGAKREVKEAATEAAEGALRGLFGRKKKND